MRSRTGSKDDLVSTARQKAGRGDPTLVTVVIPAYNEEERIGRVVKEAMKYAAEVLVVDDGSVDGTAQAGEESGARVIINTDRDGYIGAIKTGFRNAHGEIIVTLDGDGEHDPREIPKLIEPILQGEADLVLGRREETAFIRPSERFLNWLTNFRVKVKDSGTGFRALRRELALELELKGRCTCGVFVLEAAYHGARITEVPISLNPVTKGRKIAWYHFWQLFYVLWWLLKPTSTRMGKR